MTFGEGLQAAGIVTTILVAWATLSARRSARSADDRSAQINTSLTAIATDVRQLTSTVSSHDSSLAVGREKFTQIEGRLTGLEDRERQRGCFGHCPMRPAGGDGG